MQLLKWGDMHCIWIHIWCRHIVTHILSLRRMTGLSNSNVIYILSRMRNVNTEIKLTVTYILCTEGRKHVIHYPNRAYAWILHTFSGSHHFSPHIFLLNSHPGATQALLVCHHSDIGTIIKHPCAIAQLHVNWIWYSFGLILVIRWTFSTNSRNVIDFLTITSFTNPLTYFALLSISTVRVVLYQQKRGAMAQDIVDIVTNLANRIKNYQSALTILTIILRDGN